MKKNLLLFVALVSAFLLASCSGGSKSNTTSDASAIDVADATEIMKYYNISLGVLENMVKEKNVNAVLGYMEQGSKAPIVPAIVPPAVSEKDTMLLMNPGGYFTLDTRQNLIQNYQGLFSTRAQFYANFDTYLSYLKAKNYAQTDKLLDANYQLSIEMSEYKQNIFDILSPLVNQAQSLLLTDNPLKEQIMAMKKIADTMQSIVNLYSRKHIFDSARIDLKIAELKKQVEDARKLTAPEGLDANMKTYQAFLDEVNDFVQKAEKAREKGEYSEADYDMLSGAYETSIN